jgi:uncharacterized protein (UPF0333 family)
MRGTFIIGLLIVSLIVGLLVMKNMGSDSSSGVTKTQAKQYIEKAESAADDVSKKMNDISKRAKGTDND